jgi:hypothetical protein
MNESNKNALGRSLLIMEKRLDQISFDLERERLNDGLGSEEGEIDIRETLQTSAIVASMLEEISALKRKYALKETKESTRASIIRMVIELDILLDDLMPERFKAYGDLDSQDAEYLIKKRGKMKSMLNEIYGILH